MKLGTYLYILWVWGQNFYRKRNFEFRLMRRAVAPNLAQSGEVKVKVWTLAIAPLT